MAAKKGRTAVDNAGEILEHLNSIEERVSSLRKDFEDTRDLETIDKLDIINLKNDLEKIRVGMPSLSTEEMGEIRELEEIAKKSGNFKDIKNDIDSLKKEMKKISKTDTNKIGYAIESLNQRVKELEKRKDAYSKILKCKKCGAVIMAGAKFCRKCGKKV